jgi:hypothetical protein
VLPAVEGRVVDADTGEPVAFAEVFEWWHGAGRMGGPQPVLHARWTTADEAGRFGFDRDFVASLRLWFLKAYGPSYSFFAPRYGLQHGPVPGEGELVLRAFLGRAPQAIADLDPICRGERDDPGARHLAAIACGPRPQRP